MLNKAHWVSVRLENGFAEHIGPQVSLQDLTCLQEERIAGESEIDSRMVARIPGLGDREGQQRGQERPQGATVTSSS